MKASYQSIYICFGVFHNVMATIVNGEGHEDISMMEKGGEDQFLC